MRRIAYLGMIGLILTGFGANSQSPRVHNQQVAALRTVYIPVPSLGEMPRRAAYRMTELLAKEVDRSPGFKVVASPEDADLILTASFVSARQFRGDLLPDPRARGGRRSH